MTAIEHYELNGELIDLVPLFTRIQLLGDGATIHRARTLYSMISFLSYLLQRGEEITPDRIERTQTYLIELRSLLHKAGV